MKKNYLFKTIFVLCFMLSVCINAGASTADEELPNVVIKELRMEPANPKPGDQVVFSILIENDSYYPTPDNVKHGVAFSIDGNVVSWSDDHYSMMFPGEQAVLTACGGPNSVNYWVVGDNSSYIIKAHLNDQTDFQESNYEDNIVEMELVLADYLGEPYLEEPFKIGNFEAVIEAAYFDLGGEGIAYHDQEVGNQGGDDPIPLRPDEDVEIEGGEGDYNIGWTNNGEWLKYTTVVEETGLYDLYVLASANDKGSYWIRMNGIDVTGTVEVATEGWGNYIYHKTENVSLQQGDCVMTFCLGGGMNMKKYVFMPAGTTPSWEETDAIENIAGNKGFVTVEDGTVRTKGYPASASVAIYNITGQKLKSYPASESIQLSQGIYMFIIEDNGIITSHKVLVK